MSFNLLKVFKKKPVPPVETVTLIDLMLLKSRVNK